MNRRPHWDLIRGGWAGKWQFPCCFGVCSSPCSRLLCNTINILYLVLIEAVILVRHIIASWPKEKCSFISLLAAICQTDGFALCPETLHIQESSCFHMSCGKMIPPTHPYFFFSPKGMRYMDHFSFLLSLCTYQVVAITAFPGHTAGCENGCFYTPVYIHSTGDGLSELPADPQAQLQSFQCPSRKGIQ